MRYLLSAFITAFLLPTFIYAQTDDDYYFLPSIDYSVELADTGPIDCFDHYTFGSIEADLVTNLSEVAAGNTLNFSGEIVNKNPYPIVDGKLYVKIFKENESAVIAGDGDDVVDQFVIKDDININASSSVAASYDWEVPENAPPGTYYAAYFFVTSDSYNLMGLSFTDDVVGNTTTFVVLPNEFSSDSPVTFSKANTTLNGENLHFTAGLLHVEADEEVTVSTTITNTGSTTKTVPVEWIQYGWDAMDAENQVNQEVTAVTVAPGETREVTYDVSNQRDPVVYITATLQDGESKSILNIRYVRDGIPETRINFPGITKFPLNKGDEAVLFTCAHSTNVPVVKDNTITLNLSDKNGDTIAEYIYIGNISGAMGGFGQAFVTEKEYDYAKLTARIERSGVLIEEVVVEYDCKTIPGLACSEEEKEYETSTLFEGMQKIILYSMLGIAALFLFVFFFLKKRGNTSHTTLKLFVIALLVAPLFYAASAEAKTKILKTPKLPDLFECRTAGGIWGYGERCWKINEEASMEGRDKVNTLALSGAEAQMAYKADLIIKGTGSYINDGDTVPVGTKFQVYAPHTYRDIFWTGKGYAYDTPFGEWRPGAKSDNSIFCANKDFAGTFTSAAGKFLNFIPFVMNPPTDKKLQLSNNVTCSSVRNTTKTLDNSQFGHGYQVPFGKYAQAAKTELGTPVYKDYISTFECTVTAPGPVSVDVVIPPTYGHFYQDFVTKDGVDERCTGNSEVPLRASRTGTREVTRKDIRVSDKKEIDYTYFTAQLADSKAFKLETPQVTIPFDFYAEADNQPPAVPTLSGPSSMPAKTQTNVIITSTDPDKDTIRYGLSDSKCSKVSGWLPFYGYVNSGSSQSSVFKPDKPGVYKLYVLAEDSKGERSACAQYVVSVTQPPEIKADLKINGSDGPLTANSGDALNLSWTSNNASSCTLYGAGLKGGTVNTNGSTKVTAGGAGTSDYILSCNGVTDTVKIVINNSNRPPNAPIITGATLIPANQTEAYAIRGTDPDNDRVYYQIDNDGDGVQDVSTPSSGYIPSNSARSVNRSWGSVGEKKFAARTVDEYGLTSNWTVHTVSVQEAIVDSVLEDAPQVNIFTDKDTVPAGSSVTVNWEPNGFNGDCTLQGADFSDENESGNAEKKGEKQNITITNTKTFTYTCVADKGTYNPTESDGRTKREAAHTVTVFDDQNPEVGPEGDGDQLTLEAPNVSSVRKGDSVDIVWSNNGLEGANCKLTPTGYFDGVDTNGGTKSLTLDATTVITYTCTGADGITYKKTIVIEILPAVFES